MPAGANTTISEPTSFSTGAANYGQKKKQDQPQIKWIAVPKNPAKTSGITITLGQIKIEITPGFDPKLLREIIEVLT
nr:hypothetical protein [Zhaonella formicivorans]